MQNLKVKTLFLKFKYILWEWQAGNYHICCKYCTSVFERGENTWIIWMHPQRWPLLMEIKKKQRSSKFIVCNWSNEMWKQPTKKFLFKYFKKANKQSSNDLNHQQYEKRPMSHQSKGKVRVNVSHSKLCTYCRFIQLLNVILPDEPVCLHSTPTNIISHPETFGYASHSIFNTHL